MCDEKTVQMEQSNDDLRFGIDFLLNRALASSIKQDLQRPEYLTKKKPRTSFNKQQIAVLEDCFISHKYLASEQRKKLADFLYMTDTQVKTWFQNRRTKWRRMECEQGTSSVVHQGVETIERTE
ncbi:hypothetical protein PRIPAC_97167 [Pristionchus pacificus]|uniref:Homeobox domain-containing protein n=1 Tax=Pristionchus pacificus TaxID=54126 RepID=A0A454Y2P9_PRIPA|nr:hypothetical protein PRIPAC_97167 [Pristionchus pacificus]|eukprot:PDM66229.1 Homeobox domain-containing protein [Pristionchus pacificus]